MAGLHRKEGKSKYLVLRRDGTRPAWPWLVLGAGDPDAPAGIRAYAKACGRRGRDIQYVNDLLDLAVDMEEWLTSNPEGDPDAPLHRTDNPYVLFMFQRPADEVLMPPIKPGDCIPVFNVSVKGMHEVATQILRLSPRDADQWVAEQFRQIAQLAYKLNEDDVVVTNEGDIHGKATG